MWSHFVWYRYYAAYLYKCAIHNALSYEDLYCHFVSNLQGKQGLIRNSAKFKTRQFASASAFCIVLVHHCLRQCQELYYLFILFIPPQTTTTQCKLLERKQSICASGWKEKDHQRKLQRVTPPLVQGVFAPMAEGKTPPAQVAASDRHHVCKWSTCAG